MLVPLADRPADEDGSPGEAVTEEQMWAIIERVRDLQERLHAESEQALLFVFQAMDAGG